MSVFDGPRREVRRVVHGGSAYWATPADGGLELDDGRLEVAGLGRLTNRVVVAPAPRAKVGHQPTDGDEVRRVALGNDDRLPPQLMPRARR